MTIEATEKYIVTEEEQKRRNIIAFMKGWIVAQSIKKGLKYSSTKNSSKEFKLGQEKGFEKYLASSHITALHIIYNRLRHNKPHTKSYLEDQKTLNLYLYQNGFYTFSINNELEKLLPKETVDNLFGRN